MIDALLHSWFLLKKNTDYLFKGLNKLSFLFIYFFLFLFYFAYINFYNVPEDSFIYSGDQFLRFSKYETDANSFFLRKEENFGVHNCWQQMTQFWDILYFQFIYQFSFTYTTVITIQYSVALAITFILSFIGFHLINYEILKNRNLFNVFLVTFLYTINPYTGQLWHGLVYIIGLSLTYSSFPLIFYYIYTSGIKKITLIELILFITIAFIASFAFWLFAVTVFLGIFEFIILLLHKKIKLKYFLYNLSIFAVVYLLLATPIIYSIFFEMYNNGGDNNGTFSGTFGNMQGGIWYQALLLFSWAIYTVWHPRALYPFHEFYFSIPYIGSTISLYLIILSGFAYAIYRRIRRKFKVHYLWIVGLLLLIVSLFFAKGAQAPFGEVFQYLYDNTSFFKVFRSSDIRFGFTVIFSISLLLLLTIQILPNRVLKLFLIGLILTQNIYFFTGDAIRGMNVSDEKGIKFVDHIITIPQDYKEIAATINLDTEYYYVLFYPPTEYGFFKIKDDFHLGQNLESKLLQNPSLQLSSSNGMSKANFEKLSEIFETKKYDQLEFYSIKYVIVQKDMLGNEKVEDICKEFDSSKVFRKKYENPTFTLYENLIFKPIIHSQDGLDLKFSKLNPDKFIIKLKNEKDTLINFAQNYSQHWSLIQISNEMYSSYLNETSLNSFFNLFKDFRFAYFSKENEIQRNQEIKFTNQWNVLKNNDSKLDDQYFLLIYKPQVIYELLIFISVIVCFVMGMSILIYRIRNYFAHI